MIFGALSERIRRRRTRLLVNASNDVRNRYARHQCRAVFLSAGSRSFGRTDNQPRKVRATTAVVALKTAETNSGSDPDLFCERVGAHLELHDFRAAVLAALAMKERARAG